MNEEMNSPPPPHPQAMRPLEVQGCSFLSRREAAAMKGSQEVRVPPDLPPVGSGVDEKRELPAAEGDR